MMRVDLALAPVVDPLASRGAIAGVGSVATGAGVSTAAGPAAGGEVAVLHITARPRAGVPDRPVIAHTSVTVLAVDAALASVAVSLVGARTRVGVAALANTFALRPSTVAPGVGLHVSSSARAVSGRAEVSRRACRVPVGVHPVACPQRRSCCRISTSVSGAGPVGPRSVTDLLVSRAAAASVLCGRGERSSAVRGPSVVTTCSAAVVPSWDSVHGAADEPGRATNVGQMRVSGTSLVPGAQVRSRGSTSS